MSLDLSDPVGQTSVCLSGEMFYLILLQWGRGREKIGQIYVISQKYPDFPLSSICWQKTKLEMQRVSDQSI